VRVDQCVSAFTAIDVLTLLLLSRDLGRRAVRFVRLAMQLVMLNDWDVVDVIMILPTIFGPNKYLSKNVDCTGFNNRERHYTWYSLFSAGFTDDLGVSTNSGETSQYESL
jgi:hypothetical protein